MSSNRYIYVITDGTACDAEFGPHRHRILEHAAAAASNGATHFQIREKQLSAARLLELVRDAVRVVAGSGLKVLVNERADIAVAAGADGVHLTSRSFSAADVREAFGGELLIAVSTHSIDEVLRADEQGADLVVFGPVFDTPGKTTAGIEKLKEACEKASGFPVIALGGIDISNAKDATEAGAAGVAGIRCFSTAENIARVVEVLR
ncbi:MAG: thiamine phosphate synthase [Acidobacteriota bacterium]|nr:MAG: thiamine phosphate synthase [Acidobacteriota bacterium]